MQWKKTYFFNSLTIVTVAICDLLLLCLYQNKGGPRKDIMKLVIPSSRVWLLVGLTILPMDWLITQKVQAQAKRPAGTLEWRMVQNTRIPIPPPEHPRLYFRQSQVAELKTRFQDPTLQPLLEDMRRAAQKDTQVRLELEALEYLINPDREKSRATITRTVELLRKCKLADRQDACRETGRMMTTGAIVYDWLYALLTTEEKNMMIQELMRLAKTQECGYPPGRMGSVTGHASEAMIMRDMVSAGIAIYDESPEMYTLAATRIFSEHVPVRNWLYPGHAYHQGDSYGPYRYGWDTFALWIFDRMGAGNVFNPEQHYVPYYYIYGTRPDGQRLRGGDTFSGSAALGQSWSVGPGWVLAGSYYRDGVLIGEHDRLGKTRGNNGIFEFLWRDTSVKPQPVSVLPQSKYFAEPFGWMIARTGWGENSVIAEMKVNAYNFVNHQHLDAGAFQIYYRGALAIDSGVYAGDAGGYGNPHNKNYSWRSVAHNTVLVYDPAEKFSDDGSYGNDGGQRLPNNRREARNLEILKSAGYQTGKVLAHGFGPLPEKPEYTVLQGDITAAYSAKVSSVIRSFVFLDLKNDQVPAAFIVHDRVTARNPDHKKYWLLHTIEEPQLQACGATVDRQENQSQGRMHLDMLLPEPANLALSKIGGEGKEFWVFGKNFPNAIAAKRSGQASFEPGAWRIEATPKITSGTDTFLGVMQVTDRKTSGRLTVNNCGQNSWDGCHLQGMGKSYAVFFSKTGERQSTQTEVIIPGNATTKCLFTGLTAGNWQLHKDGDDVLLPFKVTDDSGTLWFEGKAGKWQLIPSR